MPLASIIGAQPNLYKFMSLERMERVLDVLLNERLYCSTYKNLNDPFEGQFIEEFEIDPNGPFGIIGALNGGKFLNPKSIDDLTSDASKLPRICSLSSDFRDVRLWSHYADSHRGVAVEISFTGLENNLHKVNYFPNIGKYSPTSDLGGPTITKVLTEKTGHWAYESEYRVLINEEYFPISGRIRTIHFGIRAKAEPIRLLQKATKGRLHIGFCKLDLDKAEIGNDSRRTLEFQSKLEALT